MTSIFSDRLLNHGPWQEFERNTARLLLHAGWRDVKLVGRPGDKGADVLAVDQKGAVWVFQCKFSGKSAPNQESIEEVRTAGRLYGADRLCVVTSTKPTKTFTKELNRLKQLGLSIEHIGPIQLKKYAENIPNYSPYRYDLREYQRDALEALRSAVLETGRGQLVLATGLGKTVVLAELVADLLADELLGEGRVLVLAHTIPLVNQLLINFWRQIPKNISTHRLVGGESPTSFEGITFATIQSFSNVDDPPYFDLVIIDEAHHLGSPSYMNTLEKLTPPKLVGATATPWRADGFSISQKIGTPVFTMGIKDGLANGYLSNVDYRIFVDSIDWDFVRNASRYGYTIAQLNKKLLLPTRDEEAIRQIRRSFDEGGRKRAIVFSPSQVHSRSFASDLRLNGFKAESLTSTDDHIQRYRKIGEFASGKLQMLCVVDIFNEGIDVPDVDMLVFLRVTHSRRIFIQQLGRGLRISPDKHNVLVLDFAADVRRIHAALDLHVAPDSRDIERLPLSYAMIAFTDKSMGKLFYEWIADLGNIQDYEEDELVKLPILDPEQFDFPETLG